MVDTPDVLVHGQSPMKHSQQITCTDETVEYIKHALAAKGIDSKQPFAFVALDDNGNVRVHASGQIEGFLDEHRMECGFQEAYEKAVHESFIIPEPTSAISIDEDQESDFGDDEFSVIPRTFGSAQSRVYRPTRQRSEREQSLLPCNASRYCCADSIPKAEPVLDASPAPSGPDEETMPRKKMSRSMRIDDTVKVVDFLTTRLKRMQQLAVKKIAKAWIKGICPKKQAKFPYQNKKCEETNGFKPRIPGWWPKQGCRFTEPDHIKRDERMTLCIHLLRLRPTPAQLKEWNDDKSDPHPTHVARGWTAFLKELAGASVFDDLQKEEKRKTESRKDLLSELYEVASMEEAFVNGEIDRDTLHKWQEDEEERRTVLTKRTHQDLADFKIEQQSRQSSESVDWKRVRKSRRESTLERRFLASPIAQPSNFRMIEAPPVKDPQLVKHSHELPQSDLSPRHVEPCPRPLEAFVLRSHVNDQRVAAPMKQESSADTRWHHLQPHYGGWVENAVAAHAFGAPASHFTSSSHFQGEPSGPSNFNHHQGYAYSQQQEHAQMVQVHQARHVPEPQFQATHNAPMYSPEHMMPVPLSSFIPGGYNPPVPSSQPYANATTPSQCFMPANAHMSMGDVRPPLQQAYRDQHGVAERHIVPMQAHGLPFTQPICWEDRRFAGPCHNQI